MSDGRGVVNRTLETVDTRNEEARAELEAMGLGAGAESHVQRPGIDLVPERRLIPNRAIEAPDVLNDISLDPCPASTGIQARICRTNLLVEIEAIAIIPRV